MGNPDQFQPDQVDQNPEDKFITWEEAIENEKAFVTRLSTEQVDFFHRLIRDSRSHDMIYVVCILAKMVPEEFRSPNLGEENLVRSHWVISPENKDEESVKKYNDALEKYFLPRRATITLKAAQVMGISEKEVRQGYRDSEDAPWWGQ